MIRRNFEEIGGKETGEKGKRVKNRNNRRESRREGKTKGDKGE